MLNKAEKTILFLVIMCVIPCLCVSIAALMISEQNTNTTCGTPFIKQTIWLNIYAYYLIFTNTIIVIVIAFVIYFMYKYRYEDETGEELLTLIIYDGLFQTSFAVLGVFSIIWNIVGAITLFRDSMECVKTAPYLWVMFLICLIIHWNGHLLGWYLYFTRKERADGYIKII